MKIEELKESSEFNNDKIKEVLNDLENIFINAEMNVGEMLLAYGNLGYKLGQNIARTCYDRNFAGPPDIEELKKLYYANPDVDISLMLSSLNTITWVDDLSNKKSL